MKCKLHPHYAGGGKPTSGKDGCICRQIYQEKRDDHKWIGAKCSWCKGKFDLMKITVETSKEHSVFCSDTCYNSNRAERIHKGWRNAEMMR